MTELAFESEELDLNDAERACARSEYRQFGPANAAELIAGLRRNGHKTDGYVESALCLSLEDYRRVVEVHKSLPDPPRPMIRRKR